MARCCRNHIQRLGYDQQAIRYKQKSESNEGAAETQRPTSQQNGRTKNQNQESASVTIVYHSIN